MSFKATPIPKSNLKSSISIGEPEVIKRSLSAMPRIKGDPDYVNYSKAYEAALAKERKEIQLNTQRLGDDDYINW